MLLTRSIRRKLVVGLGLVLLLVIASTSCSILGVVSYRRMVDDLELSIGDSAPRRDALISTLSSLMKPLNIEIPGDKSPMSQRQLVARFQHEKFVQEFVHVKKRVQEFERAWQELPENLWHSPVEENAYRLLFSTVNGRMQKIESGLLQLRNPSVQRQQVQSITRYVVEMIDAAQKLPDPANRLGERLQQAREDYDFFLRLVTTLGIFSVIVLVGLSFWGYQLIFVPIRKLHLGVRRIAEGDYEYRLDINTKCEISDLAKAFNDMAEAIQEDRANKQQEIEERSRQLVLSERLAGAGFLASGVAHEINNPLSVIMTAAYGLEMRLDDEFLSHLNESDRRDVQEYLSLIQSETGRCEKITKKLLDFSYGKGEERNRYDVSAIVDEVVDMVRHLSRYQGRQLTVHGSQSLHAWVNAPEIKQVLLNLVANALDATETGGHVDITLKDCSQSIEISVKDDGCGMTPEQIDKIFEPFFTTKQVGKGTGLGLSITHRIVRDHGGTLEVSSDGLGKGACFRLRLPKGTAKLRAA